MAFRRPQKGMKVEALRRRLGYKGRGLNTGSRIVVRDMLRRYDGVGRAVATSW